MPGLVPGIQRLKASIAVAVGVAGRDDTAGAGRASAPLPRAMSDSILPF